MVKFIECWGLYFDEVADVHPAIFSKKKHQHNCFSANFAKFLKTFFSGTAQDNYFFQWLCCFTCSRNSCPEVICIKFVIKKFSNVSREHLYRSLFQYLEGRQHLEASVSCSTSQHYERNKQLLCDYYVFLGAWVSYGFVFWPEIHDWSFSGRVRMLNSS